MRRSVVILLYIVGTFGEMSAHPSKPSNPYEMPQQTILPNTRERILIRRGRLTSTIVESG